MSIACRVLFEDFSDAIGQTYGNSRLQDKFVRACNMALDDMSYDADLSTNHAHISSIDDTISTLDSSFAHTLFAGIQYFATLLGVRPADPKIAQVVYASNERLWNRLKGQYMRSVDNNLQPEQSSSMANLGYLDT